MAMAGFVTSNIAGQVRRPRPGPRGTINQGRSFNHFPAIIAAFPNELSAIVAETTDDLGILAAILAPVQPGFPQARPPRASDPTPGTLKQSMKVKIFRRRASDAVVTGRVDFEAKDRRGHRYAKPVETGSLRRSKKGLRRVEAHPFLVDALVEMRPVFIRKLQGLEARLPR
jgi:hypothetical protein